MSLFTLHFDGSCGPKNPGGTAAYGFILTRGAERLLAEHAVIGTGPKMSNNLAEYSGLYEGLAAFASIKRRLYPADVTHLNVYGDSKLVINQMDGTWGAKSGLYHDTYVMCRNLVRTLRKERAYVSFEWIPREANQQCDDLSKAHNRTPEK